MVTLETQVKLRQSSKCMKKSMKVGHGINNQYQHHESTEHDIIHIDACLNKFVFEVDITITVHLRNKILVTVVYRLFNNGILFFVYTDKKHESC